MSASAYFPIFIRKKGEMAAEEQSLLEELTVPSVCHRSGSRSKGVEETLPPPFLQEAVVRGSENPPASWVCPWLSIQEPGGRRTPLPPRSELCLPGSTVLPVAGTKRARWPRVLAGVGGREGRKEGTAPAGPEVAKGGLFCFSPPTPAMPQPLSRGLPWLRSPALRAAGGVIFKNKLNAEKSLYLGLQLES